MKEKKALIINQGYVAGNLGDMAIREAVGNLFNDLGYQIKYDFFVNPAASSKKDQLPKENYFNRKKIKVKGNRKKNILKGYLYFFYWWYKNKSYIKREVLHGNYDIVVIGGGQLINSMPKENYPHLFSIAMFWWINMIKKYTKTDIYLIGVGARGSFNKIEKILYKSSFKKTKNIWVRDQFSKQTLQNELSISSELMPDVAFYKPESNKKFEASAAPHKKKIALMSIYCFKTYDFKFNYDNKKIAEYYEEWVKIMNSYEEKGYLVKLFYTTESDATEARNFKNYVQTQYKKDISVLEIYSLQDLYTFYQKASLVITGRMHGLLLALKYDCKVHPYILSQKIKSFNEEYIKSNKSPGYYSNSIAEIFKNENF